MGTVWLARHLALDIDVALKFIDSTLTKQVNYVERFRREARAAAQIKSPHVVGVLDYGTDQLGRPFMAMEYLEGDTLGALLDKHTRLPGETVARIVSHAARGLSKAHALGVVHRDIKPENLFLCGESDEDSFVLKVLDFGIAKAGFATSGHGTLAGQLIGSPAYMSPEQARSYKSLDHRTDLFSLAVVAYQCLTGAHPFHGNGLGELLLSICTTEPIPPSKLAPGISAEVDAWFEKALAKKPNERFQTARDMGVSFCDALGLNVASGVDVRSSYSSLSMANSRDMPAPETSSGVETSDYQATRVVGAAPFPSNTGSRIQPVSIAEALTPLTSVPHTLGVALLDHNGECLLMRGKEKDPAIFSAIASHARAVADTVESIEATAGLTHFSVRFENAVAYVRWVGPFTLVVHGDAQLRALLLTVGSNKLATRLDSFMAQLGGVEPVANLLRESGVGLPLLDSSLAFQGSHSFSDSPSLTDSSLSGSAGERMTLPSAVGFPASGQAPPPAVSTLPRPTEANIELPLNRFFGFGRSRKAATQTSPQAPQAKRNVASPQATPAASQLHNQTIVDPVHRKERLLVHRGKAIGGPEPKIEEKPHKRVIVYRGKVVDDK